MKPTTKKIRIVRAVTPVLLLLACFYSYDFYKCLSGFIANGFREPLVMLPMILAYFLPVFCFWASFYDFYVRAVHPVAKTILSVLVALYAAAELVLIVQKLPLYQSNNALGVYDALPSFGLHFPYDMLILLSCMILWQIFRLAVGNRQSTRAGAFLQSCKQQGTLTLRVWEYVLLCILSFVVFVFTGAGICATFTALENALYDARYLFLLLWVALIPMANLVVLAVKPQAIKTTKCTKLTVLGSLVAVNLVFGVLFLVLELTQPDFLVHVGKPLFLIAFSVSLPIEPGVILGIMALGTVIAAVRMIKVTAKQAEEA